MNPIAFILMGIAAVIFLFVRDAVVASRFGGRSSVALGLFFLTAGLIAQFITKSHPWLI